ncbi:MAG: DUF456 domain-containing protein [Atribacterota bacterium]|nr:DUF456 domain-containing protein [Atribacterota bacterium]
MDNTSRFLFYFFISSLQLYIDERLFFKIDKKYDKLKSKNKKERKCFSVVEFVLILSGIICIIIGIVGCIFPAIPGPPLSYAALILLQFAKEEPVFSKSFLVRFAVFTIIVSLIDYFLPLLGAKLYGTSKYGIWGAIIGMMAGIIFFPPFGMILGIFIGAIIGELIAGKENSMALKAGLVTFIGSIIALFIRLSLSLVMTFYFFIYLIKG